MKMPYKLVLLAIMLLGVAQLALAAPTGLNDFFTSVNGALASVLFFDVMPGEAKMPFIVGWLVVGSVYLTLRFGFVNLRMMGHALQVIRGRYQSSEDRGEVTPFQALSAALSATVGLGNIAGVAIAVSIGGPGATFWMIIAGFFGMTSKFTEVTLAQMYRVFRPDGHVLGGAMEYLSKGFAEHGWAKLGKGLAMLFAVFCVGASMGGGNAFQVSQALGAVQDVLPFFGTYPWVFGVFMGGAVAIVIIGGIRSIAHAAEAIVPTMVFIYVSACLYIILSHVAEIPAAIMSILHGAFSPASVAGGFIGVLVRGRGAGRVTVLRDLSVGIRRIHGGCGGDRYHRRHPFHRARGRGHCADHGVHLCLRMPVYHSFACRRDSGRDHEHSARRLLTGIRSRRLHRRTGHRFSTCRLLQRSGYRLRGHCAFGGVGALPRSTGLRSAIRTID